MKEDLDGVNASYVGSQPTAKVRIDRALDEWQDGTNNWVLRVKSGRRLLRLLFPEVAVHQDCRLDLYDRVDVDDSKAALLVAPSHGAKNVLITFGGNAGYLILLPEVRSLRDTHVIAIRDPSRCFGMCGIAGLGDAYEDCLANLRRIVTALNGRHVFAMGVSAGGYPALRYGLDFGMHGVLGFSAPTTLDLASNPGTTLTDYPYLTALYRKRREMGVDIVPLYSNTIPRPRVLLAFSPAHARDAWLANRMRGIPGFSFSRLSDKAGHRSIQHLSQQDGIAPYLEKLLAMRPLRIDPRSLSSVA